MGGSRSDAEADAETLRFDVDDMTREIVVRVELRREPGERWIL